MKQLTVFALLLVVALAGCTQKPAPVASDTAPVDPADRVAIAIEFVSVPKASVYARPAADAPVSGSYGLLEAVSILEKSGEWCLVRTFDGTGWMKQADLMDGQTAEGIDTKVPRFFVEPEKVPYLGRGEIWLQARVDADGQVIEVKPVKNTTGSASILNANAEALKAAQFYPVIEKGSRKLFVYEHKVYY